jgi:cell division septum initiation protein DivIVA
MRSSGGLSGPESLATAASDRVRGILDAAERGAAELTLEAESERRRILEEAHVEVGRQLERVAVLEREIDALLEAVRASATRLREELRALEGTVGGPREPEAAPLTARRIAVRGPLAARRIAVRR